MTTMTPSLSTQSPFRDAATVCQAIHGEFAFTVLRFKRGSVEKTIDATYGRLKPVGTSFATFAEHVKLFPQYQREGLELFAVVAVTNGEGHGNANVTHTWALGVDFDHGYPDYLIDNALIGPSFRVETSAGRFHAIWLIKCDDVNDKPCDAADAKLVLKAMALRLGGDVAYAKPSQLLRLPGFVHHKHGTVAKLVDTSTLTKTFSVDFLKQAFDVEVIHNYLRVAVPRLNDQLEATKDLSNDQDEAQILQDVESALPFLRDYAEDYTGWFSTLSALARLGHKGKKLAETFSRYSNKFDQDEVDQKYEHVLSSPGHVGTIFLRAQDNGWTNPGYRNVATDKSQVLTDRDFGRMIAVKLGDAYAVTESTTGKQRKLNFFDWSGFGYRRMSEIDKREAVERAGKQVLTDLTEHHGTKSEVISRLQHKIGNNRTLDEVCDHVAEALVKESKRRVIGSYPYFVVANGVLNLLSQELVPAKYKPVPEKGTSPIVFDPAATAPVFMKTVREVFEEDDELIRYFYQILGFMMCGLPKEQKFVVMFGPTAGNGKNTVMDAVEYVMGGYAMKLPAAAILIKSHVTDGATPSTARMEGKRMVVVSEPNDRHTLDTGVIKQMAGDLTMPVRNNYEDSRDIDIEFLLVMMANKLPKVSADDHGFWRRAQIVPFNRAFRGAEIDADLPVKLRKEGSGILNLMLAGARDYLINGLCEAEKVRAAISEQKDAVDPVAAFLEETMRTDVDDDTPMKMLFQIYEAWRAQNHTYVRLTKQQLGKKLEEKGHKKSFRGRLPYYHGLCPIEIPD